MSYARTLQRAINTDLVDQIEANGSVAKAKSFKTKSKPPRDYTTYRGYRRNQLRRDRA